MNCFLDFYERLDAITTEITRFQGKNGSLDNQCITVDVLNPETTKDYFDSIDIATTMLFSFFERYIANSKMRSVLQRYVNTRHRKNYDDLKLVLVADVIRAYQGMNHSTRLQSPEGIAILLLLVKLFCPNYYIAYETLKAIPEEIINLDGIIPYISECSDSIAVPEDEIIISTLLEEANPRADLTYRICLYNLCEAVSKVDGFISPSEKEYIMTLLHLDDDDVNNDINVDSSLDFLKR